MTGTCIGCHVCNLVLHFTITKAPEEEKPSTGYKIQLKSTFFYDSLTSWYSVCAIK